MTVAAHTPSPVRTGASGARHARVTSQPTSEADQERPRGLPESAEDVGVVARASERGEGDDEHDVE